MRKKKISKKYLNLVKQERKKPTKSRKQYARIVALPGYFDYLVGEFIRVIPSEEEGIVKGVVQREGYEGLVLSFEPQEVEMMEGKPPTKASVSVD